MTDDVKDVFAEALNSAMFSAKKNASPAAEVAQAMLQAKHDRWRRDPSLIKSQSTKELGQYLRSFQVDTSQFLEKAEFVSATLALVLQLNWIESCKSMTLCELQLILDEHGVDHERFMERSELVTAAIALPPTSSTTATATATTAVVKSTVAVKSTATPPPPPTLSESKSVAVAVAVTVADHDSDDENDL